MSQEQSYNTLELSKLDTMLRSTSARMLNDMGKDEKQDEKGENTKAVNSPDEVHVVALADTTRDPEEAQGKEQDLKDEKVLQAAGERRRENGIS